MNIDSLIYMLNRKSSSFIEKHYGQQYDFSFINDNPQFRHQCIFKSELEYNNSCNYITLCEEDMNFLIRFIDDPDSLQLNKHEEDNHFYHPEVTLPESRYKIRLYESAALEATALVICASNKNYRVRLDSNEY